MSGVTVLGLAAAALTTGAFVPQVVKTYRTRSSADLSGGMYALLVCGTSLWLAYGLLVGDLPIIVANVVTLALELAIVAHIVRHRPARRGPAS